MIASLRADTLGAEARTDICIIGGGAAGVTLALELSGRGKAVLLVESGGLELEPDTQTLCDGESVGHPFELDDGRHRVLGGAATRWTGRCAKLDPIDFEVRDWVPHSGWPFGLEEIEPYYARAAAYCGRQVSTRSISSLRLNGLDSTPTAAPSKSDAPSASCT